MADGEDASATVASKAAKRRHAGRRVGDTRAPADGATRLLQSRPDSITMHAIEDKELSRLIDGASSSSKDRANLALGAAFGAAPSVINAIVAMAGRAAPSVTDAVGAGVGLVFLGVGVSAALDARRTKKELLAEIEAIRRRPAHEVRRSRGQ